MTLAFSKCSAEISSVGMAEGFAASDISSDIALAKSAKGSERTKADDRIGRR